MTIAILIWNILLRSHWVGDECREQQSLRYG